MTNRLVALGIAGAAIIAEQSMQLDRQTERLIKSVLHVAETGSREPRYGSVAVAFDHPGGMYQVSYGAAQAAEHSGALRDILGRYIRVGVLARQASGYFPQINRRSEKPHNDGRPSTMLARDQSFIAFLKNAANDPVMQAVQEEFFHERYFLPAMRWCDKHRIKTPLGALVVYDSFIQSGGVPWHLRVRFAARTPNLGGNEHRWVTAYVYARDKWLRTHTNSAIRASAYRTAALIRSIELGDWQLLQPLEMNGVTVNRETRA